MDLLQCFIKFFGFCMIALTFLSVNADASDQFDNYENPYERKFIGKQFNDFILVFLKCSKFFHPRFVSSSKKMKKNQKNKIVIFIDQIYVANILNSDIVNIGFLIE